MNSGVLIEQELESLTENIPRRRKPGLFQKEFQEITAIEKPQKGDSRFKLIKNTLIEAVLENLTNTMSHYAKVICERCSNPNMRLLMPCTCKHAITNSTTESIWILRGYHKVALRCLNEYDVLNIWDRILFRETICSPSVKKISSYRIQYSKCLKNLTLLEVKELLKSWVYFKKNVNKYGTESARGPTTKFHLTWEKFWETQLKDYYCIEQ